MTTLRTAAQQALEALEKYRQMMLAEAGCRWDPGDAAITALKAALAQEQDAPTVKESLQAEPATTQQPADEAPPSDYRRGYWAGFAIGKREGRIEAENASLAAALASSCDEQRHELWESGGIAGCERARVAERQRDALLEAYRKMKNVAAGYSNLCDGSAFTRKLEREFEAVDAIARAAIKAAEETK